MAIRRGDVEVQKSQISSLLEAAEQKEAAFYDPITQAFKLGSTVVDTLQTAMVLEPAREKFMEGFRGEQTPIYNENLMKAGITSRQDTINQLAKTKLGDTYAEGVNYQMLGDGSFVPTYDIKGGSVFGYQATKPYDLKVKAPKVKPGMFPAVDISTVVNFANTINSGFKGVPFKREGDLYPVEYDFTTPIGEGTRGADWLYNKTIGGIPWRDYSKK